MKFQNTFQKAKAFLAQNTNGVIIVVGPTASGKTSLSIQLAHFLHNGEIINADSRQIYSGLPLLTAVPTQEEQENIPHHLFEIQAPEHPINVSQWKDLATQKIQEIHTQNNTPIICGGTGLWINSLTKNFSLGVEPNEKFREEMQTKTNEELWKMLEEKDPEACKNLHMNNKKYIIRALEICEAKGKKSDIAVEGIAEFPFFIIGITHPREALYARIEARNEIMLKEGLVDEVRVFLEKHSDIPSIDSVFISHGVPEISAYLRGDISLDEAKQKMMQITKNYAKRQLTWWRKDTRLHWVSGQTGEEIDITAKEW